MRAVDHDKDVFQFCFVQVVDLFFFFSILHIATAVYHDKGVFPDLLCAGSRPRNVFFSLSLSILHTAKAVDHDKGAF